MDMNSLKEINDRLGHDAGDSVLQRIGNVLNQLVQQTPYSACRIGGDEFVVLLPGADEAALQNCLQSLEELLLVDNQFYSSQPILLSIGSATNQEGESMEDMLKRADMAMYQNKRNYYLTNNRRKPTLNDI